MSGAQLESAGQVRNADRMLSKSFAVSLLWVSGAHTLANITLDKNDNLPFDKGPDKSGRVFISINGAEIILTADSFVGNPTIDGWFYYLAPNGKRIYLKAIHQTLTANTAFSIDRFFLSEYSFNADSLDNIGAFGFENQASALGGTATFIASLARINVGFFGDYAEPDFDTYFKRLEQHEHIGLPQYLDDEDTRSL